MFCADDQQLQAPRSPHDGYWAPCNATWGLDNRTASFRVIMGRQRREGDASRDGNSCPGADVNPYLAMAAVIAAGLHGVEKGLKLTAPPITGTNQGAGMTSRALPRYAAAGDAGVPAVRRRARLARRHLRRPLRRHPRMGMPAVAGCRDRLGAQALLRDHLMTTTPEAACYASPQGGDASGPAEPDPRRPLGKSRRGSAAIDRCRRSPASRSRRRSTSAPARARSSPSTCARTACAGPLIVTDRASAKLPVLAAHSVRRLDRPRRGRVRRRLRQPDRERR